MKNNSLKIENQARRDRGFTLVELLFAVFFIFAALTAIIVTTNNVSQTGKHNEAVKEIKMLVEGARAWKGQPVRAGNNAFTGIAIQVIVAAGIDIAPFKINGARNPVYGLPTYVAVDGGGFKVIYGVSSEDDFRNCKSLLDKFNSDPQIKPGSACTTDRLTLSFYR